MKRILGATKPLVLAALFLAVASAMALFSAPHAKAETVSEIACFGLVQGNIPWNYQGNKNWDPNNVKKLCAATLVPNQPGECFNTVMTGGINWGGGTQWQWQNALDLCRGSNLAVLTIGCFQIKVATGTPWQQAIQQCSAGGGGGGGGGMSAEALCFDNIQGQIAWNYQNNKNWAPQNVKNLCAGTNNPQQPGKCFATAMFGNVNWGGGTQWQWQNAIALCKGANNANLRINCFKQRIANGLGWQQAIDQCNGGGGAPPVSAEQQCFDNIQGQIAWNYQNNKNWAPQNIQNLCSGTSNPSQPGQCFQTAMFGNVNWGGGTQWQWQNAIALCKGTNNATQRINCFKNQISNGKTWQQAIAQCTGAAPPPQSAEEQCFDKVQGQIAWNYQNNKNWVPQNVKNLCAGTNNPTQPGQCFSTAMFGNVNWGGGTQWQWQNAIALCKGANSANQRINCFKNRISNGIGWQQAIAQCTGAAPQQSAEEICFDNVQGKIAWNYQNNKNWAPQNVKNLCAGTSNPTQPGQCFSTAMFGNVNWGGGTQWQWQNAINLCKGANNANQRINCFKNQIANGKTWQQAINQCN